MGREGRRGKEREKGKEREEEEKEREEGEVYSSEPPVTDLDSVIESMAGMTLGDMGEAEEDGVVVVGEGEEEERREEEEEKDGEGEEMEVEEEGREGNGGGGEVEEEDGATSTGHTCTTKTVDPPTVDQQDDCKKGLDLPKMEGHGETSSRDSLLLEGGENGGKGILSDGCGPATPTRPGAGGKTADKRTLSFLLG